MLDLLYCFAGNDRNGYKSPDQSPFSVLCEGSHVLGPQFNSKLGRIYVGLNMVEPWYSRICCYLCLHINCTSIHACKQKGVRMMCYIIELEIVWTIAI